MTFKTTRQPVLKFILAIQFALSPLALAHETKEAFPGIMPAPKRLTLDELIDLLPGMAESAEPLRELIPAEAANDDIQEKAAEAQAEEQQAPAWVNELKKKTLAEYFPSDLKPDTALPQASLDRLQADAIRLHEYFESKDSGRGLRRFVTRQLKPFIDGLTAKKLLKKSKNGDQRFTLAEWNVEMFVLAQQVTFIAKQNNPARKFIDFIAGRHMRGASLAMRAAVVSGSVYLVSRTIGMDSYVTAFVLGALTGGVYGVTGEIAKALTSWGLSPTTQYIKVMNSRYTADLEIFINKLYDQIKPTLDREEAERRNERARIANLGQDGMNFGYMSVEDQEYNFEVKNKPMWVAVTKTYGQLLRDDHHYGRALMEMPWKDEQLSTQLVELLDSKLHAFNTQSEVLLTRTVTVNGTDAKGTEDLMNTFDHLQYLCSQTYLTPFFSPLEKHTLRIRIYSAMTHLLTQGVSARDLEKLMAIQGERARTTGSLITAVTVNELISMNHPENNRNLDPEARQAQRAVRRGFNLQSYVDRYFDGVRRTMNDMGYRNKSTETPKEGTCARLLARLTGNHVQDIK